MDAAGIVADHAADGAAVVAGGIGSEGEVMFFGGVAEMIEHDAGLHACDAARGIDLEDARHVLGKVQHHRNIAALTGQRRAATTAEQGRAEFAAHGNGGENIVRVMGKDYADGDLAVVGTVGGVERTAAVVEANLATEA